MLADLIRPSGWHDFWFGNRSAGERATTCCSGPLCQSRVQTNTHKPILWEKRSRFNPTYGLSMGALWSIALCTCRKQLILKPPCLSGSCLDQQNRQMKNQGENLKRFSWSLLWPSRHSLLLWPSRSHTSMSLAAQHTAHSAEIKSTRYRWNEKGVVSCCTMPYALTSSFSSVRFKLCEVQNAFHLPRSGLLNGQTL